MNQEERRLYLIKALLDEMPQYKNAEIPDNESGQRQLLRSLFNIRPPYPASLDFLQMQDEYLSLEIRKRGIVDCKSLGSGRHRSPDLSLAGRHYHLAL